MALGASCSRLEYFEYLNTLNSCKYAFAHFILKAMVVERNDFWFMDDGALTYHICEVKTKIKKEKKKHIRVVKQMIL